MNPSATGTFLIVLLIGTVIFNTFSKSDITESFRKQQAKEQGNESESFMKKLERQTNEKTKYSKRAEVEKICKQAGFKLKYHEFFLLKVICSIALCLFAAFIIGNPFLAVEMIILGQMIPMQVIMFIRNKRVGNLEKQIGPMMQMVIKRYLSTRDFTKAMALTRVEFKGMEPMYTELNITVAELEANVTVEKALDNLAERCDNKFLEHFSDCYKIASAIGTQEARQNLLGQAYLQYEEDRQLRALLKRELSEPVKDSYILVLTVPLFACFGFLSMDGYADFLLNQLIGQIMVAALFGIVMGVIWFINNKIGAPLK